MEEEEKIKGSEIVDYLSNIIEHGTRWELLELYNSYTNHGTQEAKDIHADEVDWEN